MSKQRGGRARMLKPTPDSTMPSWANFKPSDEGQAIDIPHRADYQGAIPDMKAQFAEYFAKWRRWPWCVSPTEDSDKPPWISRDEMLPGPKALEACREYADNHAAFAPDKPPIRGLIVFRTGHTHRVPPDQVTLNGCLVAGDLPLDVQRLHYKARCAEVHVFLHYFGIIDATETKSAPTPAPVVPPELPQPIHVGLNILRQRHPDLLAKPGPCAVLRVLLADPDRIWSANALATMDDIENALPSEKASNRSVRRWLESLREAGLALPHGVGTAKRWRLNDQNCRRMPQDA